MASMTSMASVARPDVVHPQHDATRCGAWTAGVSTRVRSENLPWIMQRDAGQRGAYDLLVLMAAEVC
eukprot:4745953-Heterocapsa_arctica.AAC.1